MKVLIFGVSGMVGQGVLRECLADPAVAQVCAVGRSPLGSSTPSCARWWFPICVATVPSPCS
jgi:nucleoside-diphosphate-sugar epimerase